MPFISLPRGPNFHLQGDTRSALHWGNRVKALRHVRQSENVCFKHCCLLGESSSREIFPLEIVCSFPSASNYLTGLTSAWRFTPHTLTSLRAFHRSMGLWQQRQPGGNGHETNGHTTFHAKGNAWLMQINVIQRIPKMHIKQRFHFWTKISLTKYTLRSVACEKDSKLDGNGSFPISDFKPTYVE